MSVTPICAITDPSIISIIRCTTDSGCTRISICSDKTKQPVRFNHFQSLVHQRRRIDRDLRAHGPGRVAHRFGNGRLFHLLFVLRAEWSARSRENDASHFLRSLASQTLVQHCARVDRQQLGARLFRGARHQLAAITSVSLFASATRLPASSALSVGTNRTAPTVAEITQSACG